jgi:hypothetical protein
MTTKYLALYNTGARADVIFFLDLLLVLFVYLTSPLLFLILAAERAFMLWQLTCLFTWL